MIRAVITDLSRSGRIALILLEFALVSASAHADPASEESASRGDDKARSAARQFGYAGVEAYEAGDYAVALALLEQAYDALHVPTLGLWSARAMVKVGRLSRALERYREVSSLDAAPDEPQVQKRARADAELELAKLSTRVPRVIVRISGAAAENVTVLIDEMVASTALAEGSYVDPGSHRIEAREGARVVKASVTVDEGDRPTVLLAFPVPNSDVRALAETPPALPSSTPAERSSSPRRTLGWVGIIGGAAGAGLGTIAGVLALGKLSDIRESSQCRDTTCTRGEQDLVDNYNALRTTSTIGFIAGGVLAAAGTTLVLTAPVGARTSVSLGPGMIAARRHF